ncbi:MAG: EAL domain-containing protein [Xanthomonadaceae bacterium]|nr:EAL domain-containing protein [Xanthomonadaceae bacterium]
MRDLLQTLVSLMPKCALVAFDAEGVWLDASPYATKRLSNETWVDALKRQVAERLSTDSGGESWRLFDPFETQCRMWSLPAHDGGELGYLVSLSEIAEPVSPSPEPDDLRWNYVLEKAPDAFWDWDTVSGLVFYSPRFEAMLGYQPGSFAPDVSEWVARLHPDDRERSQAALRQHMANESAQFSVEHRLRHRDGRWLWTHSHGRVVQHDGYGAALRLMGTLTDISDYKALESQLREREALLLEAQRIGDIGAWAYDPDADESWWSEQMYRIYGLSLGSSQRTRAEHLAMYTPDSRARLEAATNNAVSTGQPYSLELEFVRSDGKPRWILARCERLISDLGRPRLVGVVQDITARRHQDAQFRWQANLLAQISSMGRIGGFEWDLRSRQLFWTEEVYHIHRIDPGSTLDPDRLRTLYDSASQHKIEEMCERLRTGQSEQDSAELCLFTLDGRRTWLRCQARAVREGDEVVRISGLQQDITAEREAAELIEQLAHFDGLTGLPNRFLFRQRAQAVISDAQSQGRSVALLFIDLDRFKNVNDSLGHVAGDHLLFEMAGRLRGCVRSTDLVGRHSGDEFLALLNPVSRAEDAGIVASKILEAIGAPVSLDETELQVGCSIGIAVLDDSIHDLDGLLQAADTAMYAAKEAGRNTFTFYSEAFRARVHRRVTLEAELRQAVARGQLHLAYQPTVYLKSGAVAGIEALLRWTGDDGEQRFPDEFIPIAEECGEIVPIGDWVLRQAVRDARQWRDQGLNFQRIAVNVSAVQLRDAEFANRVVRICNEEGWDPKWLQLELTESTLMRESDVLAKAFDLFEAHGISLAVDDFGTGFSNLHYLNQFPVQVLKIDRSFTEGILTDVGKFELSRAIIGLGHALDMQVVAEGVETQSVHELLRSQGCDESQGYYVARPMDAEALVGWLTGRD